MNNKKKPIVEIFKGHIQYGDLQINNEFLPKSLKEMNEQIEKDLEEKEEEEDYSIG